MFKKTGAQAPVFYFRYHCSMNYQAKLSVPFGMLGIRCEGAALCGIDFLPDSDAPQQPIDAFTKQVCAQLLRYLDDPAMRFTLPLFLGGTAHQRKVWQAMSEIPHGTTRSYGELAAELHSSAQAVGQACGANPLPIVIPCHRVVAKSGLGGFMRQGEGAVLDIKRWLLAHETSAVSAPSPHKGEGWGGGKNVEFRSYCVVERND